MKKPVKDAAKKGKGRAAPASRKRADRDSGARKESVSSTLADRGREIPFQRHFLPDGGTLTYYGLSLSDEEEDADGEQPSSLICSQAGDTLTWYSMGDGHRMKTGETARRQLTGIWDEPETQQIFKAVEQVFLSPETFQDAFDGAPLRRLLFDWITTGEPRRADTLRKCIAALHSSKGKNTKRQDVARAVVAAARKAGRVPMAVEALQCYANTGRRDDDEKNFRGALKEAGYGWLIVSKKV